MTKELTREQEIKAIIMAIMTQGFKEWLADCQSNTIDLLGQDADLILYHVKKGKK